MSSDLWLEFTEQESEFRVRERQITAYFCAPDANGTLESFRSVSANHFTGYIEEYDVTISKFEFEVATDNYDAKRPQCEVHYEQLVEKGASCDAFQTQLEEISCQRAIAVRSVRTDYTCNWRRALDEYEAIVAEVEALEADRKTECHALEVVRCLLGRAQERNGRPCDEVTDEAQVEYTHCEVQGQTVDCTWLDIIYPVVPPYPPVPNPVDHPCSASFIATEYNNRESGLEGLTFMPTAVFHSPSGIETSDGNAHCNQPQTCQTCPGMDDPVEECSIPPSATPALWQQHLEDNTKCQANDELTTLVANQAECQAMAAVRGHSYYSFRSTASSNGNHKCRTSETCGEPDLRTGTTNPWNVFRAFTLAGTDLKCPHEHGDRLFRNPASGTSSITLEQCRQECLMTAGCNHFSHGGGGVCMGCVSLTNAQTHEGFNAYNMLHAGPETQCNARYEAEAATMNGGQVDSDHDGYTGSGFFNFVADTGDYIEWSLPSCSGGEATLAFRYALTSGDRPLQVLLNEVEVRSALSFPATGAWTRYGRSSVTVTLQAGTNTVRLVAAGSSGANTDSLLVLSGTPSYHMGAYGDGDCPAGHRIMTYDDCKIAHAQLELEIAPEWEGTHASIPSGCSTREYNWGGQHHFHWDEKALGSGVPRDDLAPICSGPV